MARYGVRITGVNNSIMQIGRLSDQIKQDIGDTTEAYARKIANEAAAAAPVRDGLLQNSIETSPTQVAPMTWELGSDLPYAMRQEYEHPTKKGFTRNAVEENRDPYYEKIKRIAEGG